MGVIGIGAPATVPQQLPGCMDILQWAKENQCHWDCCLAGLYALGRASALANSSIGCTEWM
jgi:hypothetical protein